MQKFILTKDHITLLQNAYIRWDEAEFGAPAIDPKRPYGSSSVIEDICHILGFKTVKTCEGDYYYSSDADYAYDIHHELQNALEVVLQTKSFKPGVYVRKDEFSPWKAKAKKK